MKSLKLMIVSAALILSATAAMAQDLRFGVKGGIAASWLTHTVMVGDETIYPHNSIYAGALLNYEVSDNFILQTELIYSGKGHTDKNSENVRYSRRLGYIQLPLFAGYRIPDKDFTIMAGPELGCLVHSATVVGDKKANSTDQCRPFNLAFAVQTNYMINYNLGIDFKFDWGLTPTFKSGMYADKVNDDGHNFTVQVGLSYLF